jgi:hypothetical protein
VHEEALNLAVHLEATVKKVSGEYARHFDIETGLDVMERDRPAAFVINTSDYATVLEVGSSRIKNPPMPMTKALDSFTT